LDFLEYIDVVIVSVAETDVGKVVGPELCFSGDRGYFFDLED
jgi:hypothetical protein